MRPSKLLFDEIVNKITTIYELNEAKSITFLLFEAFTGFTKTDILTNKLLAQNYDFEPLIQRILNHEPVQYIVGYTYFYGNKFVVKREITLIPRPETEELVQLAIDTLGQMKMPYAKLKVLDIGTGSGCIAISIAKALDNVEVEAWDIDENALKIAQLNAQLNKTEVHFHQRNVLERGLDNSQKYDLIISNPPYVTQAEKQKMHKNVLDFEPHLALFVGDHEPLLFYEKITEIAKKLLKKEGILMFEINENYGPETLKCIEKFNFENIEIIKDIHNKDRIIVAVKK